MYLQNLVMFSRVFCVYIFVIFNCICNRSSIEMHFLDDKNVVPEYPERQAPGHGIFEKTGVEVIALGSTKSTFQHLPRDLALQATSNSAMPGSLEEGEIALSPAIAFCLTTKLDRPVEVLIPHGANMILSPKEWSIILKELRNGTWVSVSQHGSWAQGIKSFAVKSNHVRFETDHLSTFAVVGRLLQHSVTAFKRMKVVAFCSETSIGEDLHVRVYCFDDCEYSFEVCFLIKCFPILSFAPAMSQLVLKSEKLGCFA